ncbi:hypothetical protein ABPG77_000289 [Micractinium sp. CCAP 211/92]
MAPSRPARPANDFTKWFHVCVRRRVTSPDELSKPPDGTPLQVTPLVLLSAFSTSIDAVKILLDAGAAVDGLGSGPGAQLGSPLIAALRVDNLEMARELLERGASLHTLDPAGDTVLHSAMAGGPAVLRLVLGAMQQRLTRAQRRELFQAQTLAGLSPIHMETLGGDTQRKEALQLLIAGMQQDGLQVRDSTGQLAMRLDSGISRPEAEPAVAEPADSASASASVSASDGGCKKKAKSRVGPALSEYVINESSAGAVCAALAEGRHIRLLMLAPRNMALARKAMQEAFDAAVADDPHSVYAAFDPAWRSLSPAAQLDEGRRILALLQPSSSAPARPLFWHTQLSSTLSHLFFVEPSGDRLQATEAYLLLWCTAEEGEQAMLEARGGRRKAAGHSDSGAAGASPRPKAEGHRPHDGTAGPGLLSGMPVYLQPIRLPRLPPRVTFFSSIGRFILMTSVYTPAPHLSVPSRRLPAPLALNRCAQLPDQSARSSCHLSPCRLCWRSRLRGCGNRLWQAGHTAVTVRELDALLAAAEAEAANELLKGTLHVLCKAPSARYLPEMKSLRLPSKALQLLGSVVGMLEGGKGRDNAELWVSLQRQLSCTAHILVMRTGAALVPSLLQGGILSSVATLVPKELRRQRVGQVLGLPGQGPGVGLRGPDDPAWLAARPLTPLQQLIWHIMHTLISGTADAHFVELAVEVLQRADSVLRGSPIGVNPAAAALKFVVEARWSDEEAEGPRCACCGALGGTAGTNLRKCLGCRAISFCGAACQLRNWRLEHRAVCGSQQQAASS